MAFITYTAIDRNDGAGVSQLVSGHSESTEYSINFSWINCDKSPSPVIEHSRSLDGTTVTTAYSYDDRYSITTEIVTYNTASYKSWMEFFHSVRNGETFIFHPYNNSTDSPNQGFSVILENGSWSESRIDMLNKFRFSFTVIANANL